MSVGPRPDPVLWVTLAPDRPPRILRVLFWGTMATTLATLALTAWQEGRTILDAPPVPVVMVFVAAPLSALLCCLLWPLLPWAPTGSAGHRTVSTGFLCSAAVCALTSNAPGLLLVCVASVHAVAVFGVTGGAVHAVALAALGLTAGLAVPGATVWSAVYTAATVLFLAGVSAALFLALSTAAERARRTSALLTELEAAHEELRVRNRQVREMTLAEERARMSREMHDSTGHHLTALAMTLSNALRFRVRRPEEAWNEVEQARDLAREALQDTRRWVRALRPLTLDGLSGPEAMRVLAESFDGTGVRVDFAAEGTWPDLPGETELVCYRALQEALTNAVRHSASEHVRVRVRSGPGSVAVTVEDEGRGELPGRPRHGFGLRGVEERAASVGGHVSAGNRAEGGFRFRVEVPVPAPAHEALTAGEDTA